MGDEWKTGIYSYKICLDTLWLLVFHHETSAGFFANKEQTMYSTDENKFSILSLLSNTNHIKRYNESFEFLLEYPKEVPGKYNRWLQSFDPLTLSEVDQSEAPGFTPIHLDWTTLFKGLLLSSANSSLLDGCVGNDYWWYAIGDYKGIEYGNNTPGPLFPSTTPEVDFERIEVSEVSLWIRISPILKKCTYYNQYNIRTIWSFLIILGCYYS